MRDPAFEDASCDRRRERPARAAVGRGPKVREYTVHRREMAAAGVLPNGAVAFDPHNVGDLQLEQLAAAHACAVDAAASVMPSHCGAREGSCTLRSTPASHTTACRPSRQRRARVAPLPRESGMRVGAEASSNLSAACCDAAFLRGVSLIG